MKHYIRKTAAACAVLLLGLTACADLDVVNPNAADRGRALGTPGDVQSLIAGSFSQWWRSSHDFLSGGPILANASFQMSSWPANFGMVEYSQFPRKAYANVPTDQFYTEAVAYVWNQNYRALSAVAEGLKAFDDPEVAEGLGAANVLRVRAFGKFMQGMAHGSLALHYSDAWILDETKETLTPEGTAIPQPLVPYPEVMEAALGYFDDAIALATGATFTIPSSWTTVSIPAADLIEIAHSMKARYRANVARTPAEREAVDWAAVIADVDAGVEEDWNMRYQFFGSPFWNSMVGQFSDPITGWAQVNYLVHGMADQSGMYQDWLNSAEPFFRDPQFPDGSPRLIHTPDLRFPQGATEAAQRADVTARRGAVADAEYGAMPYIMVGPLSWGQPARGPFRWSYYRHAGTDFHRHQGGFTDVPEITIQEMNLLKAEGLLRSGGLLGAVGAATLINLTRVEAGLNATDAAGTNTSCVPRLPDASCGDLMEMLKWEKRMETAFFGVHGVSWYFDGRGWGDLYEGTPLQRPVPCLEMEIAGDFCNTFGGVGGASASPGSVYGFENYPQ